MSLRENQEKSLKAFENILTKETVVRNIFLMSFFVMFFELLKHFVDKRLKELYCEDNPNAKNDKTEYLETVRYRENVKSLDKNIFIANIKWFQNQNVLSADEYKTIIDARERRNVFVHNFFQSLTEGFSNDDFSLLLALSSIYYKLDSWWNYHYELPDEVPDYEDIKQEDCRGSEAFALQIMFDALTRDDNKHITMLEEIRSILKKGQQ